MFSCVFASSKSVYRHRNHVLGSGKVKRKITCGFENMILYEYIIGCEFFSHKIHKIGLTQKTTNNSKFAEGETIVYNNLLSFVSLAVVSKSILQLASLICSWQLAEHQFLLQPELRS